MVDEVEVFFEKENINYKKYIFCKQMISTESISKAMSVDKAQILKTYLLKNNKDKFFGVVLSGQKTLNMDEIKVKLDENFLTKVNIEFLSPISLTNKKINTIYDKNILSYDIVNIVTDCNKVCYEVTTKDLFRILSKILVSEL
ncbi:YbaK/EbsC family protein [Natranaerofaba carboxydovora]|uniref:YbaK/EbsC family protein n=1 Tax=Natranaerofaba carboxydovora TaxID=2742683 RepID=UPI001F12ED89|nr:YbaK/EbsC family protein [Natranaerofaba carboxydovora]UMZ73854.1 Aminoacyl-tRNA editing domain protein [Natranaerofaba carboxydovora]